MRPRERALRGLAAASLAVVGGVVLTELVWWAGFIAGITAFATAFGSGWLYTRAAGAAPRRGLVPLVVLIVVGVALSVLGVVVGDLLVEHRDRVSAQPGAPGRTAYVRDRALEPEVLRDHEGDAMFFLLFGVLGTAGTVRRLTAGQGDGPGVPTVG